MKSLVSGRRVGSRPPRGLGLDLGQLRPGAVGGGGVTRTPVAGPGRLVVRHHPLMASGRRVYVTTRSQTFASARCLLMLVGLLQFVTPPALARQT